MPNVAPTVCLCEPAYLSRSCCQVHLAVRGIVLGRNPPFRWRRMLFPGQKVCSFAVMPHVPVHRRITSCWIQDRSILWVRKPHFHGISHFRAVNTVLPHGMISAPYEVSRVCQRSTADLPRVAEHTAFSLSLEKLEKPTAVRQCCPAGDISATWRRTTV